MEQISPYWQIWTQMTVKVELWRNLDNEGSNIFMLLKWIHTQTLIFLFFYIFNFCFRLPKSMFTRVVVNANYEWMMWQKDHPNISTQYQSNIFHINNIEQKAWKSGQISSLPKIDIFCWFITVLTSRGGNTLLFSCHYYHGWGQPWLLHQKHLWGPKIYNTPKIWKIFF